jgi:hypothetical protein
LRHQVPGAIGVGAKSTARAIATGNVGHRIARPLTLGSFGGCLETEGDFRSSHGSRPDRGFRGSRCSSGPWSCSWRHPPAEVVRGARGLDSSCESSARRGLAGVSHTGENARQLCRPASRDSAPRRALARASGPVPYDGRHLDRGTAAGIDVPHGEPRSGGREWFRSSGSRPGARKRGARGDRSTGVR